MTSLAPLKDAREALVIRRDVETDVEALNSRQHEIDRHEHENRHDHRANADALAHHGGDYLTGGMVAQ